jgi:putative toxin-antitoxin system antitoxin component (TIGR02293 family)
MDFINQKELTPTVCRQILLNGIKKQDFSFVIHTVAKVPEKEFAKMSGTSTRTISRLKSDQIIPEHVAEVTLSVMRVFKKACEIFGSEEKASLWMKRSNAALNGAVPLFLLGTRFGAEEVMDVLTRLEYGVYS